MDSVCGCVPAPGAPSSPPVVARAALAWPADAPQTRVISREARLRSEEDFRLTIRRGIRVGRESLVLHALRTRLPSARAGFVVSKAVGNAVTRNRVKRRLRHLAAGRLSSVPFPVDVVVRALPASTTADLAGDFGSAWEASMARLAS
jgi:ribonuclease P protein component